MFYPNIHAYSADPIFTVELVVLFPLGGVYIPRLALGYFFFIRPLITNTPTLLHLLISFNNHDLLL